MPAPDHSNAVGKYRLIRKIGQGGMAEIFLARASGMEGFEKIVVLKRVLSTLSGQDEFIQMLLEEARLAATLHHPNIVQVFDVDAVGGVHYVAMEYVHGVDLRDLMSIATHRGQAIPIGRAVAIALGVAAALHHAHEKRAPGKRPLGIVHRDVSASNILLSFDGAVKLTDFGIARATARSGQTTPGTPVRGKLAYMSPEQCNNQMLDRRTDIFSLGVVLYELLAGRRPFDGDSDPALLYQISCEDPPPLTRVRADIPAGLIAIIDRALAKEVADRYQTAADLQFDLEQLARTEMLDATPGSLARFMSALVPEQSEVLANPFPEPSRTLSLVVSELPDDDVELTPPADGPVVTAVDTLPPVAPAPATNRVRRVLLIGASAVLVAAAVLALTLRSPEGTAAKVPAAKAAATPVPHPPAAPVPQQPTMRLPEPRVVESPAQAAATPALEREAPLAPTGKKHGKQRRPIERDTPAAADPRWDPSSAFPPD